ncbi:MAG: FG-GAP repeat protein [Deltaproteobacteria bacterium]|nr:FG-GAP repeat protein [Deltaproteobacteria bacterium]
MARARRILATVALAAAGCTLVTEFWTQDEGTPVQSFGPPAGYQRSGFGTVVVAVEQDLGADGGATTLLAVSAGLGSAAESYHWAAGDGLLSDPHLMSFCAPLRDPVDDVDPETWGTCEDAGTGAALLWVPSFRFPGDPAACEGVLLIGQPLAAEFDAGRVAVLCPETHRTVGLERGASGSAHFGRSLALVPAAGGPFLAIGAAGAVWVVDGPLAPSPTYTATAVAGVNTDSFGLTLAGGATADDRGYLAVGASTVGQADTRPSRLVLLRTDPSSADPGMFRAAGCIEDAPQSPLGSALLAHDFDGDGNGELVYRTGVPDVQIADGAAIEALAGLGGDPTPCTFDAPAGPPLACPTSGEFGVECSGDFGAALAAGDLNLDGRDELLVGDPGAKVGGVERAGAVHVFENDGTGWERTGALFDASPESGARMGTSIAVAPIRGRPEPFVGSAGSGEVFVFYCSGLAGDKPREPDPLSPGHRLDDRCLAQ